MDISGAADLATNDIRKGFAVVGALEGTGSVLVSVGAGRGDAIAFTGPSRGNVVIPGIGRGRAGVSSRGNMGNAGVSGGTVAESSAAASREEQLGGSVSGYATGPAGNGGRSRGPEVPLPEPTPIIASVLDPEYHYKFNFGKDLKYVKALSKAIRKMADPAEYIAAIPQIAMYINSRGPFDASDARDAARQVSATDWWVTFGVDTEILQKYAILIVSQCTSSSGCERNWSTFALVHTQVRNRLGFEKLHKMVYCHYNLGLRIRQSIEESKEIEVDACAMLLDVSLHDHENPILDWLTNSMSESVPLLDECDNYYHHSPCPVVVGVVQKRKSTKKRSLSTIEDSEEEEEEEEEEEQEEEDSEEEEEQDGGSDIDGDEGNHGVLPPNNSTTLPRKSTRKRRRTIKAMSNMKNKQV